MKNDERKYPKESPLTSIDQIRLTKSPIQQRVFSKRNRSASSSLVPSPMIIRKGSRTPSMSSLNASNSACILDEDETNTRRCFCPFPLCMNFLDDAAKAIRRKMDNVDSYSEQQLLRVVNAKVALATENDISLRDRKENIPPDMVRLLETSDSDSKFVGERRLNITESLEKFLNYDAEPRSVLSSPTIQAITSSGQVSIFRKSRFSNVPPTIRFVLPNERGTVEKPKKNVRRMLKWCYNSLVPKVVRKVLYASHFQIVSEDAYWIGYWGRHLRTQEFHKILPYQKINHFPGTFHLGRKDRLWINIRRMMQNWDNGDFAAVMPRTFVLPKESKALKIFMKANGQAMPIILKPPASARGNGITVVHRWAQIPRKEPMIAQVYVDRPCLIDGKKFDLRLYVFVTSFNPLRIYLYEDGLARFASVKYSNNLTMLNNRLMHLTNYSLNKRGNINDQGSVLTVQKWSLKQLWRYLSGNGHDVEKLMEKIVDLILKAFISCENQVNTFIRRHLNYPFACHELFGIDIVLDEQLTPSLLEINISPSFHTSTELDLDVKSGLARDVMNLIGVRVPDRIHVDGASPRLSARLVEPSTPDCLDLRTKQNDSFLTVSEKAKQEFYTKKYIETNKTDAAILDHLTPSDIRVLIDTEDEYDRRGQFARIFPSPFSTRYLKYFEKPRYYNLLLEEWIGQYDHIRETGCSFLESFCKENYHIRNMHTQE